MSTDQTPHLTLVKQTREEMIAEANANTREFEALPSAGQHEGILRDLIVGLDPCCLEFFRDVLIERHHQDEKFGREPKTKGEWLAIFVTWTGKLAAAIRRGESSGLRHRIVQVAAIALNIVEVGFLHRDDASLDAEDWGQ